MFDIDGTLTETLKVDDECFVRTAAEVYGYTDINTDWTRYPHATDSCIAHEIYQARTGRPPTKDDISRFRRRFVELIGAASSRAPFTSVAGCRAHVVPVGSVRHIPGCACHRRLE